MGLHGAGADIGRVQSQRRHEQAETGQDRACAGDGHRQPDGADGEDFLGDFQRGFGDLFRVAEHQGVDIRFQPLHEAVVQLIGQLLPALAGNKGEWPLRYHAKRGGEHQPSRHSLDDFVFESALVLLIFKRLVRGLLAKDPLLERLVLRKRRQHLTLLASRINVVMPAAADMEKLVVIHAEHDAAGRAGRNHEYPVQRRAVERHRLGLNLALQKVLHRLRVQRRLVTAAQIFQAAHIDHVLVKRLHAGGVVRLVPIGLELALHG